MQVIDRSLVFQDPNPNSSMRSSAFPCIAALSNGRLLVSHRVGSAKDSADGTLFLSVSDDGGSAWTGLGTPFLKKLDGIPGELRYGGVTELEPGRLLMCILWVDRSIPDAPFFHPETEGLLPVRLLLTASQDEGRTWSPYRTINVSPMIQPAPTGPILRLPEGPLLLPFETNKEYHDAGPWHHQAAGIFSTDEGMTWCDPTVFAADPEGRVFYWDQRMAVLRDGSLIALYWTFDREEKCDLDIHASWSHNKSKSWSRPVATGLCGQIAAPIPLQDGRTMMVYVHRHAPPSLRARLSDDGGKSWDAEEELIFYDHGTDRVGAAQGDTEMKTYLQDMELWSFGLPSGVQLSDGDVRVVYYAGAETSTGIHVARIRV